jgi:hypothetical protein
VLIVDGVNWIDDPTPVSSDCRSAGRCPYPRRAGSPRRQAGMREAWSSSAAVGFRGLAHYQNGGMQRHTIDRRIGIDSMPGLLHRGSSPWSYVGVVP